MSAFFTFQARRSHSVCFVTGHSQWKTTASYPVPRIRSNLNSWIIHALLNYS